MPGLACHANNFARGVYISVSHIRFDLERYLTIIFINCSRHLQALLGQHIVSVAHIHAQSFRDRFRTGQVPNDKRQEIALMFKTAHYRPSSYIVTGGEISVL